MPRKQEFVPEHHTRMNIAALMLAVLVIGVIIGIQFSPLFKEKVVRVTEQQIKYVNGTNTIQQGRTTEMLIAAVDNSGNGVAGKLITTVKPGTGLILVNINDVFAQADTQLSAKTAAKAASNYSSVDLSGLDIIYSIKVNASVVEGPSAGASMAMSVLASLENKTLDPTVAITGTIDERGNVGTIGGVLEKEEAARSVGIDTFLVPPGQGSEEDSSKRVRQCAIVSGIERCKITYEAGRKSLGTDINVTIVEVRNIGEASKYFFEEDQVA